MTADQPAGEVPAWSARYARYLQDASTRAARTAELNRQLMRLVARGDLTPTTIESRYTAHTATYGGAYADELAETTMRFLGGLVQAGTAYSAELVDAIAPGEFTIEPAEAPRFDHDDWSTWFSRLTEYAASENVAMVGLVRALLDKVASGSLTSDELHAAATGFHDDHLPGTVERMVGLLCDLLTGLDDAHHAFTTGYLESVIDLATRRDRQRPATELDAAGPLGSSVTVRFAVTNEANEPASVRTVMTDVRRVDGVGPAFEPAVTIRPERAVLAPGAEEIVAVSVRLGAPFEAGCDYTGTLHVLTPDGPLLEVGLRLRASDVVDDAIDGAGDRS